MEHVHHPQGDPMVISLQKQAPRQVEPRMGTSSHHMPPPPPQHLPHGGARFRSRDVRRIGIVALVVLGIVILGMVIYSVSGRAGNTQSTTPNATDFNPTAASRIRDDVDMKNTASVVAHIGTLILLPSGEQPTVATVSNLDSLKGQAFFAHARVGDVVLMYAQAKKAILYNPQEDKIIEVAPIVAE